jgi:hypothetical protein
MKAKNGHYDMSGLKVGDKFLGCPACHFRHEAEAAAKPECPDCRGRMNVCHVELVDVMRLRDLVAMRDRLVDAMRVNHPDDTMTDDWASSARLTVVRQAVARRKANIGVESRDGLLWRDGRSLDCLEADRLAMGDGYFCAEQLVKAMAEGSQ